MDELEQQTREVLDGKPPTQNIFPFQVRRRPATVSMLSDATEPGRPGQLSKAGEGALPCLSLHALRVDSSSHMSHLSAAF